MPYWACVQTRPQGERLAACTLGAAGYSVYLPRLRETRRAYGRKIETARPLFPGYLFALIELQWHAAAACIGVVRLVRDGDRPARVSDAIIAALKARETDGLINLQRPPRFLRGDQLRVTRGVFEGHFAIFE